MAEAGQADSALIADQDVTGGEPRKTDDDEDCGGGDDPSGAGMPVATAVSVWAPSRRAVMIADSRKTS